MDEYIEGLCDKCQKETDKNNRCNRCGETIDEGNGVVENKNFDMEKFEEMAGE